MFMILLISINDQVKIYILIFYIRKETFVFKEENIMLNP